MFREDFSRGYGPPLGDASLYVRAARKTGEDEGKPGAYAFGGSLCAFFFFFCDAYIGKTKGQTSITVMPHPLDPEVAITSGGQLPKHALNLRTGQSLTATVLLLGTKDNE